MYKKRSNFILVIIQNLIAKSVAETRMKIDRTFAIDGKYGSLNK